MKCGVSLYLLMMVTLAINSSSAATCDPADTSFICGVSNGEDLIRLPGTPWVIVSQLNMDVIPGEKPQMHFLFGPIKAIRIDTREVTTLYPTATSDVRWDRKAYPDCSKPAQNITSQGLSVRPLGDESFRLYVVNHGGRESVEVMDVVSRDRKLNATWRGCILMPEAVPAISPNSVAVLPDDGLIISGGGGLYTWKPGQMLKRIAEVRGANGVEVSRDGRTIFVADSGEKLLIKIASDDTSRRTPIKLDFRPDNVHWGEDGNLYVVGTVRYRPGVPFTCISLPVCTNPFAVAQIDALELAVREVFRSGDEGILGLFGAGSSVLQMGNQLWVGTVRGDRIAVLRLP